MSLTQEQIKNIANLSKLRLKNEEKITANINDILNYVDQLNEVDTTGVKATSNVINAHSPLREDEIVNSNLTSELLNCSNQNVVANQVALQNIMK